VRSYSEVMPFEQSHAELRAVMPKSISGSSNFGASTILCSKSCVWYSAMAAPRMAPLSEFFLLRGGEHSEKRVGAVVSETPMNVTVSPARLTDCQIAVGYLNASGVEVRFRGAKTDLKFMISTGVVPQAETNSKTLLTVRCKFIVPDPGTDLGWACR
jgi:hypothetical protein